LTAVALSFLGACIAPSVLDKEQRAVAEADAKVDWRPAEAADFDGLFESVRIEGEAAASLWRIEYCFSRNGSYTGAALVLTDGGPEFQTLTGTWSLDKGVLSLEGSDPAKALAAPGRLRFEAGGGSAEFRKVTLR
jgi:hypothetical protein